MTIPGGASTKARSRAMLHRWRITAGASRSLLSNAASLFGATILTVGFGAIYWALAARIFPATAIGLAAAAISAMLLTGQVATIGLGTVLMGELSQHEGSERGLIYSAATISAIVGAILGVVFITAASSIVPELSALNVPARVLLFAIGVAVTAAGLVLDQAFIGLLRGGLQLLRNTIAAITKLVVLIIIGGVGFLALRPDGATLVLTWVVGGVASMALLLAVPRSSDRGGPGRPLWHVPEGLAGLAVRHHLLNLSILAPGLLLPLVVTAVMSAEANAYFYIAYMIASFGWAVPAALATALYASGARDIEALSVRVRLAFWLSMGTGIALNLFMLVGAGPLLSIFGAPYADRAGTLLRLLSLGIFPVTINSLYVPIARLERRFLHGTLRMVASMLIEFAFVVAGARAGGLDGTGVGWLIGVSFGVLPLVPAVFRVGVRGSVKPISRDAFGQLPGLDTRPDALGDERRRSHSPAHGVDLAPQAAAGDSIPRDRPGGRSPGTGVAAADRETPPTPEGPAVRGTGTKPRLTFVIATDGPSLTRWQAVCLEALLTTPGVSVDAWVHQGIAARWRAVNAKATEPLTATETPPGLPAPTLAVDSRRGPPTFDVLLDLTRGGSPPPLAASAREEWSFAYGAEGARDAVRAGMRDVIRGAGLTRIALVASPGGRVLRDGALRTADWSIGAQLDQMLFESATWPALAAASGSRIGPEVPEASGGGPKRAGTALADAPGRAENPPGTEAADKPDGANGAGGLERVPVSLLRLGVTVRRLLAMRRPLTQHDDWNVGIVNRPIADFLGSRDIGHVTWLPSRRGRYAADPFGLEEGGVLHVFFEDFDQRLGRAVISHTAVDSGGKISDPEQVLDPGCHVSYPFLVKADGAVWMIPETADAAELRLYVAVDFPRRWRLETKLLTDAQVSDPTVIQHAGRWWLFGTSRGRGVDHALRIWHAPRLTGPWSIHRLDPVKTDAGSARPAGTPFVVDGVLYRPSQDSTRRYGGRVVLNRVDTMDLEEYLEHPVAAVGPPAGSRYPDGLHTLSAAGSNTLIDGNAIHFVPAALRAEVGRRLPWSNGSPD